MFKMGRGGEECEGDTKHCCGGFDCMSFHLLDCQYSCIIAVPVIWHSSIRHILLKCCQDTVVATTVMLLSLAAHFHTKLSSAVLVVIESNCHVCAL